MANDINGLGLDPSLTTLGPTPADRKVDKNDQVSKDEFIMLLVTQLKNQDPLNPMENDEFAVKLAQFSQLEQLMSINDTLESQGSNDSFSSLATYLGNEVVLNNNLTTISDGEGNSINFELSSDAVAVNVDIMQDGNIVDTIEYGAMEAGEHTLDIASVNAPDGEYEVFITAMDASGGVMDPEVNVVGTVTGFIPGPDPMLLIGEQEVSPSDIKEVRLG